MRLAEIARIGWLTGAATLAVAGTLAVRAPAVPTTAPAAVDHTETDQPSMRVRTTVSDDGCAGDVKTEGNHIYVYLPEDPASCSGIVRVYRVEHDQMIFEQELVDI